MTTMIMTTITIASYFLLHDTHIRSVCFFLYTSSARSDYRHSKQEQRKKERIKINKEKDMKKEKGNKTELKA